MAEIKSKVQPYESYKDSGVEWLGEIPEHWQANKLKYVLTEINERSETGEEELLSLSKTKGVIPKSTLGDRSGQANSLIGYKKVYIQSLVINKMQAVNGLLSVSKISGITSPDYSVYKTTEDNDINYFGYLLNQPIYLDEFKKVVTGVMEGFIRLYTDDLYNIKAHIPPLSEQTKIAQFLDDKTTKIDDAIAIKVQQINLLKERKQILIHKAVTRGLDDSVALKDSGVEWIGEIPEHWEVKPLKYIGNSIIGLTYSPNNLCEKDEGTLVFRSSNLFEGKIKYGEKENVYVNSRISNKLMVRENDILICSRNGSRDLIGKCALISKEDIGASFGAFTTVFRSEINPYIFCILNSSIFKALSGSFLTSTINQLTIGNLNSIFVPVPPKEEREILKVYINNFSDKIETAISLKQQEIDTLKEYKSSLINGVVTGKVRVC
jgi:type I restriction enzyme S subunit